MHPNAIVSEHASISQEVEIDPYTIVDSHVRVGVFSFVAAVVLVNKDVLPYTIADGQWVSSRAVNKVRLKRAGFSQKERLYIDWAVRILLKLSLTVDLALESIASECGPDSHIEHLTHFVSTSERGIARK